MFFPDRSCFDPEGILEFAKYGIEELNLSDLAFEKTLFYLDRLKFTTNFQTLIIFLDALPGYVLDRMFISKLYEIIRKKIPEKISFKVI